MRSLALFLAVLGGPAIVGCSVVPTEEGGEPRFDAVTAITGDAGACSPTATSAGAVGDAKWSDLYRDYFGPTGVASCAGTGQCHGDTTQPGFDESGYVCGPTAAACYAGITSTGADLVTVGDTTSDPTTTALYAVLRKCAGGGSMPRQPTSFMFTAADMTRIAAWIKAGAPND